MQVNSKLIVVVLDGLNYDTARRCMGYLEHLTEHEVMVCCEVKSELPSNSRPLYEVLLTGTPAYRNGITANSVVRLSRETSVFQLAAEAGLTTAAAAYHWVSELYNGAPFDPAADRHQHDPAKPIQHGMFYFEDHYPDSHLFADAEHLRRTYAPDFLYIHSMNIDDAGHRYGGNGKEYEGAAKTADTLLAMLLPGWLEAGYRVIVTADHGMNANGMHGGTTREERIVPLYLAGLELEAGEEQPLAQLGMAGLMCRCLGLEPPASMRQTEIPVRRLAGSSAG
ncbi:alkaline phosphatase family protein [Paenibacillus sp. CN-4]|uniref:alkaline phosphatase family protein n=1 Tax=Paenibacillus nanchangensis TaxID=3348343 RepID=UPI0039791F9F